MFRLFAPLTVAETQAAQDRLDKRVAELRSRGWLRWRTGPAYDRHDLYDWTLERAERKANRGRG